MNKKLINSTILLLLIAGIILTGVISYKEYVLGDYCANFTIIPTCYIVFFYFVILLIIQVLKKQEIIFLILLVFALVLITFASISHFTGNIACALFSNGFPTCYVGFIFIIALVLLKYLQVKNYNER